MHLTRWNVEEMTGYHPITTFWEDFSIADNFGASAIKDTYRRAFKEWKVNYKYMTELVMVLNYKIWQWYGHNDTYAKIYNDLWQQANDWCCDNLTGKELDYFYRITD